jgi:hypothetical protein
MFMLMSSAMKLGQQRMAVEGFAKGGMLASETLKSSANCARYLHWLHPLRHSLRMLRTP